MLLISFIVAAQHSKILFITSFTVSTFTLRKIPFPIELQSVTNQLLAEKEPKLSKIQNQNFPLRYPIYPFNDNKLIVDAGIRYILETKKLDGSIF